MVGSPQEHIDKLRNQGMDDDAITYRLSLHGFAPDVVKQTLQASPAPYAPAKGSRKFKTALTALGIVLLLAAAVPAGFYLLRPAPVTYSISLPQNGTSTPLVYGSWPALADPQFYDEVKNRFVGQGASFITADLSTMQLTLYEKGVATIHVPILAKGKVGSWWETPVGIYEINTREENHFSSFGHVYQPWSLAFQGNFFIHGWPYYEGGAAVASTYSGGCIRLSTDDAEKVYDHATVGMPVLVYNTPTASDSFHYEYKSPDIIATAYVAADIQDGTILANQNNQIQLPIASISKLMTALVVVEYLNLEKTITVPREALVETTRPRLHAGQQATVHDLLILMLTESSNEAAETLAAEIGRSRFIDLMNKKATAIGLNRTSFIDPSGLGVGNSSTAEDMFTLLKYLYDNRKFILSITAGTLEKDAYGSPVFKDLHNYNKIAEIQNKFIGGKVGETNAARETYAGIFNIDVGGVTRPVAVIVLGADNAQESVQEFLKHLNSLYGSQ
ncbi:L,D-transpeptidase family protein [Candidatus Parcubacteria bacterium]|nr:L,D-transpeptidase family protein [Candidatus Parcubacteria bacterium]